jgi:peptidoglycan hydrolase-like protein with peptidoglycan-binding domain
MPNHIVQQGECLSVIAAANGFPWKVIWDHPSNAEFKKIRKNPNILFPGDVIFIPDKETKEDPAPTEQRHVYVLEREKVDLNLRMMREDKPLAKVKFSLTLESGDFKPSKNETDRDGWIREKIPPTAKSALLILFPENEPVEEYQLLLGHLDPVEKETGVAARLKNLGLFFDLDEEEDEALEYALKSFQGKNGLPETGNADSQTLEKLKQMYGS